MKTIVSRKFLHLGLLGALLFLTLTGGAQPVITNQPVNQTMVLGGSATFSVMATGVGPLIYQWQLNGTNVVTNGIITTLAGGTFGFSGDGVAATNANLESPYAVAADTVGNLFIAEKGSNRIRKIDTNGIMTTAAGNGTSGFSGDGGAATNANLNQPYAVAADSFGNLFIADYGNMRIRKVDTNGFISTVAGGGGGADGVLATNAILKSSTGVAVDTLGNIFIAETSNNRIRKVDTNGIISTMAGSGTAPGGGFSGDGGAATNAKLSLPFGVVVDNSGNLFIADEGNGRVREVNANGIITTVAGKGSGAFAGDGGQATNANIDPQGIFVDNFGYIYIADFAFDRIRQVDANGIITTVAGYGAAGLIGDGGYATNASVYAPKGVALDNSGNLLIADTSNNRIRKVFTGRNPVLKLNNVSANSAGNYQVIVTGTNGSVTSSNASLTILFPPSVTTQPTNFVRVVNGSSASLNVSVTGDGTFGYQWFTSSGRTAAAMPFVIADSVQVAFVIDPGAGYVSTPQVHFIGGSGSGATATATVQSGSVVLINMNNHGSGYAAVPPTIQIDSPPTNNAPLPNQTNAILTLLSVTSTDATNYFVVVTNNYGSVTSATVFLTVFLPPQNFSAQNVMTGLQMNLTGTPSFPYIVQSATNLTPPISWQSVRTNYSDVNGNWQFTDTNLNSGQKFYRALGQ
jgi:sugar lactone lactonase YvrE